MRMKVSYNLIIAQRLMTSSSSSLDDLSGGVELEAGSSTESVASGPSVMIKVVDRDARGMWLDCIG